MRAGDNLMIIALLARQIDPISLPFHRQYFKGVRSIHAFQWMTRVGPPGCGQRDPLSAGEA